MDSNFFGQEELNLVRSAHSGNPDAMEQLLAHEQLNKCIIRWASPHCEKHLRKDVAQCVRWKVSRSLKQLRRPEAFLAWVKQITRREARRIQRQWNCGGQCHNAETPEQHALLPAREATPLDLAAREETRRLVRQAIEELDEPYRRMIQDRLAGLSIEEISRRYGCPTGTVKRRLHTARRKLGRWLEVKLAP